MNPKIQKIQKEKKKKKKKKNIKKTLKIQNKSKIVQTLKIWKDL